MYFVEPQHQRFLLGHHAANFFYTFYTKLDPSRINKLGQWYPERATPKPTLPYHHRPHSKTFSYSKETQHYLNSPDVSIEKKTPEPTTTYPAQRLLL